MRKVTTMLENLIEVWKGVQDILYKCLEYFMLLGALTTILTFLTKHKLTLRQKIDRIGIAMGLGIVVMFLCDWYLGGENFAALKGALSAGIGLIGADIYDILNSTVTKAKYRLPEKIIKKIEERINDK